MTTERPSLVPALAVALALTGCVAGPDYVAPAKPGEQAYVEDQPEAFGGAPGAPRQSVDMGQALKADWWTLFGSADLDHTVDMALANNWSIKDARSNLARAAALVTVAQGGLYPQVNAGASALRQKFGATTLGPEAFGFPVFSAYAAAVDIGYAPDVFGATRRTIEQADANRAMQDEAVNAAHLGVAGEVVAQTLQIAAAQAQIDALMEILVSDRKTVALVREARTRGAASQPELIIVQAQLDRDQTMAPDLVQQRDAARDALAVLVGRSPAAWSPPSFTLEGLSLPGSLPLTVPSDLVRARPDIRAAEAELHAASAAVGVATADLYPKFDITASVGASGLMGGPTAAAWSLIGGVTAPIFHGGALSAQRRAAQDAYDAAFARYQETVLEAFGQIAETLHALAADAEAARTQQQALSTAKAALALARRGHEGGDASIVEVLDAQRLEQLARIALVRAQARRFADTTRLFVASGGGLMATKAS